MQGSLEYTIESLEKLVSRVNDRKPAHQDWPLIQEVTNRFYNLKLTRLKKQEENLAKGASSLSDISPEEDPSSKGNSSGVNKDKNTGKKKKKTSKKRRQRDIEKVYHSLPQDLHGSKCKKCGTGRMYKDRPRHKVIIRGQSLLKKEKHIVESLRCRCCNHFLVAKGGEVIDQSIGRFDESASANLLTYHYLGGMPFLRLESLQSYSFDFVSKSEMWEVASDCDDIFMPVYNYVEKDTIEISKTVRYDDTGTHIVYIKKQINEELKVADNPDDVRTGVNASTFYFESDEGPRVLYFSGLHHAGEVLGMLLANRKNKKKIITLGDAASKNLAHDEKDKTTPALCNAHAFRRFKETKDNDRDVYAFVAEKYKKIYDLDEDCKLRKLTDEERLIEHQTFSAPLMQELLNWAKDKIKSNRLDLNSNVAKAIQYLSNQWEGLSEFLRTPGVPLDSNLVEQVIKSVIRYRKSSIFYQSENGAAVGDRIMSLGRTVIELGESPIEYFEWLLQNRKHLKTSPQNFTPWAFYQFRKINGPPDTVH